MMPPPLKENLGGRMAPSRTKANRTRLQFSLPHKPFSVKDFLAVQARFSLV